MASIPSSISPTTTAPLTFETWKGPLTSWKPPASCSRVTEATETHFITNFKSTTSYEKKLPDYRWPEVSSGLWEGDVRSCFPPYMGHATNYYYPASCPVDYTSYTTETTITSSTQPGQSFTSTTVMTFLDAICCPERYTIHFDTAFERHYCTRSITSGARYDIVTWHLYTWKTTTNQDYANTANSDGMYTSRSSYARSKETAETVTRDVVLTLAPLLVRYANPTATHTPTETVYGTAFNTSYHGSLWSEDDEPSGAVSPKMRKLLLGLCIPLGILFFSAISYIIWYIRRRGKKNKASQIEQAGTSGSSATETVEVVQVENKEVAEPTHREVLPAERSGSLPPESTGIAAAPRGPKTKEQRKFRHQEESLRRRREQLALEEDALRRKRAESGSGM